MGKIWFCKIGEVGEEDVPQGGDSPMRNAVESAYLEITGREAQFTFSGWGGELDERERAVVEDRLPDPEKLREEADEIYRLLGIPLPTGPIDDSIPRS